MNQTIQQRCERLNIQNNLFLAWEGQYSSIEIYVDIPDLQYKKDKILLIQSVLLPSIKDILDDTYPHLLLDYVITDDMIQVGFNTKPHNEETYIDIIEHIISIIETIHEDNQDTDDVIVIQYNRAITFLRIL